MHLLKKLKWLKNLKLNRLGRVQVSIPGVLDMNLITQSSSPTPIWKWSWWNLLRMDNLQTSKDISAIEFYFFLNWQPHLNLFIVFKIRLCIYNESVPFFKEVSHCGFLQICVWYLLTLVIGYTKAYFCDACFNNCLPKVFILSLGSSTTFLKDSFKEAYRIIYLYGKEVHNTVHSRIVHTPSC